MTNYSSNWLRNLFFLFLIIQLAPTIVQTVKKYYDEISVPKTKVGIITIKGQLSDTSLYVQQFRTFCEDESIKAILLKIDSPGGFAGASASLNYVIRSLKTTHRKPVVTWIQNMCASGGYYIAAAADYIIATPVSGIGSIGAYIPQVQLQQLMEQLHIKYDAVHAGKYKTTGNPLLTNTPEQTAMLQQFVDDTYQIFVKDILECRPMLASSSREIWADGKIFTGQRALELGLIDQVGSPIDVEQALKEQAHITTEIAWIKPPQQAAWMKLLSGSDGDNEGDHSFMSTFVDACMTRLEMRNVQTTL